MLPKIEVVTLQVQEAKVVLTETVERLVGMGQPLLAHVLRVLALDGRGHDRPASVLLLEHRSTGGIEERHPARGEVDADAELRRGEGCRARALGHIELRAVAALGLRSQTLAGKEGLLLGVGNPDDVVCADLELEEAIAHADDKALRHALKAHCNRN